MTSESSTEIYRTRARVSLLFRGLFLRFDTPLTPGSPCSQYDSLCRALESIHHAPECISCLANILIARREDNLKDDLNIQVHLGLCILVLVPFVSDSTTAPVVQ
jgi:hypothetical protein